MTISTKNEELGKKIFYCTNNSTKSRQEYVKKCKKLGFPAEIDNIVGSSYVAASYLKDIGFSGKVYVIGSTGVTEELDALGIEHIGMENAVGMYATDPLSDSTSSPNWSAELASQVLADLAPDIGGVVCAMDLHFGYKKLMKAASILARKGTVFVATNTDEQFPSKSGKIVVPVETAAGRPPLVMGKPSTLMFEAVKRVCPGIQPERTLMIGDRANTDILFGKNCGLQTLLVGTGCDSLEKVRQWEASQNQKESRLVPDYYTEKLGDLLALRGKFCKEQQ